MATAIPKNVCEFTLGEVAGAIDGEIFGASSARVRGVSIDTRSIEAGALFVALKGATDGHQFLRAAAASGARAAMVERGRRVPEIACVEIDDTLVALGRLAHHHVDRIRKVHPIPSITIGGAAGKTTTKEITAALARAVFGATLATPGNLNNLIGVPMTLFMLDGEHRAMVIECGTNTRGEIARLSAIVEPEVAMVLNVDLEHTEGLGALNDIADEEAAIFGRTRRAAIIPAGDPMLSPRIPSHLGAVTFGASSDATVRLSERKAGADGRTSITIHLDLSTVARDVDPVIRTEIALIGSAAAMNCTAAVAAIAVASPAPLNHAQLRAMETALGRIEPVAGRLATREIGGVVIIDDTYNAQPPSVRVGLEAAREVAHRSGARLVIALGDMLELGPLANSAHREAVRDVLRSGPALFLAIGAETCAAADASRDAIDTSDCEIRLCGNSEEAARLIVGLVRKGDVVFVKGSRGIKTERIVEAIVKSLSNS